MSLKVLAPVAITDAMLISSTVAETAPAAYVPGTTYPQYETVSVAGALGLLSIYKSLQAANTGHDPAASPTWWEFMGTTYEVYSAGTTYPLAHKVISTTTHRIYESVQAANTGNPLVETGATPVWWLDFGPTNKWALLDGEVSTPTTYTSPLTMVLQPGFFNGIGMLGVSGDSLAITVKDAPGGNVIYSYSGTLEGSQIADYYEYCFSPFEPITDFVGDYIAEYSTTEITITINGGGTVSVGMLLLGDMTPLGETLYGVRVKPKSYSYVGIDDFGNSTIVRRKKAKDMSVSARLALREANGVVDTINALLDVPCLVIASEAVEHAGMRVFGLVSGEIDYDNPQECLLTMDVKGMI